MRAADIIAKKRDGLHLTGDEIDFLVAGFCRLDIPDFQMAAWLMAAYLRGLDGQETVALTRAMAASGGRLDFSSVQAPAVDKHSTGGIGDKTSLVVVPLTAAAGVAVPKMSGRGLGHTGGTLDKLSTVPGLRLELTADELVAQVRDVGCAIVGQTEDMVPADKKIYALRDQTATTDSVPLIAASILSKKLAGGTGSVVFDVKCGSGAFMTTLDEARRLAKTLVSVGEAVGLKTLAVISRMNEPLGTAVGNALEVREAIEMLAGAGPPDLRELSINLAAHMLVLAGIDENVNQASKRLSDLLDSGQARSKFRRMVAAQGGDTAVVDDPNRLPIGERRDYLAGGGGFFDVVDAGKIGLAAAYLGAGRLKPGATIDPGAGLVFKKKRGDVVQKGEVAVELYAGAGAQVEMTERLLDEALAVRATAPAAIPLIYEVLG